MELISIDDVKLDPNNARRHPRKNIDEIKKSLLKLEQQKPIVLKKDMTVVAGNGTVIAARELGWKEIWVKRTKLNDKEAMAYALADNQVALSAEWIPEVRDEQLEFLSEEFEMDEFGFDLSFLEKLQTHILQSNQTSSCNI